MKQLRHYQTEIASAAADLLHQHKIAYLAMQVRTGKTITSMETARIYGARTVLFVTRKKAIGSIEADYLGNYKTDFTMYCVNYEQLHNLPMVRFDLIILDEAHCLGQYPQPSGRAEAVKKLAVNTPVIYLSGTPSPESYSQFYHQLWVSSYSPFTDKNFYQWAGKYVDKRVKFMYNRSINDYSCAKMELIEPFIKPIMISYTQEEAGFEMPVVEHVHMVQMSDTTAQIIAKLKQHRVVKFQSLGRIIEADTEVKLMGKIHQLCSGTVITDNGALITDKSKANYIFNNFQHKKIAIFYKFAMELDLILSVMSATHKITDNPELFNSTGNDTIFVSQIVSGREGINLSSADCLIMYNIDFSAVSYWQSRARLQTKERSKEAEVHWLFSVGGIEEKIYKVVQGKKDYTLRHFNKEI